MTNQEITSAVKSQNVKSIKINQEQLAQLFKDAKLFLITDNSYEYSVSRTYTDENVKMLITKRKYWDGKISYDFFINQWF